MSFNVHILSGHMMPCSYAVKTLYPREGEHPTLIIFQRQPLCLGTVGVIKSLVHMLNFVITKLGTLVINFWMSLLWCTVINSYDICHNRSITPAPSLVFACLAAFFSSSLSHYTWAESSAVASLQLVHRAVQRTYPIMHPQAVTHAHVTCTHVHTSKLFSLASLFIPPSLLSPCIPSLILPSPVTAYCQQRRIRSISLACC